MGLTFHWDNLGVIDLARRADGGHGQEKLCPALANTLVLAGTGEITRLLQLILPGLEQTI